MNILILESSDYDFRSIEIYKDIGSLYYLDEIYDPKNINCLVVRLKHHIDKKFLNKFTKLKYILTPTTALTHLDLETIKNRDIKLLSLRDCKKELVKITSSAEHALILALLLCRNINNFNSEENLLNWERYKYKVNQISSLKIGIIGLGRIGKWLKNVLEVMGANVIFNDIKEDLKKNSEYRTKEEVIRDSDLIILSCTYDFGDKEIIGFKEISYAKNEQLIVNIARGGVIKEEALYEGIVSGKIKGYATDVLIQEDTNESISSSKLIKLIEEGFNVIITPHIGGVSHEAMRETEYIIANKFKEYLINERI